MILTFGRIELPYEQMTAELAARLGEEGVDIAGVSRVAISGEALGRFAAVLTGMYERWQRGFDEAPGDGAE